ncbi:MAG: DNA replication/repair protein RecF [Candidatus Dormibacteria bacterium]
MKGTILPLTTEGACTLLRLRLFGFRSYADESVEFGPRLNLVGGRNAQGKTNLLEAVATLLLTRSPRAAAASDVLAWGGDEAQLQGTVRRPAVAHELALRLRRDAGGSGHVSRTVSVDGNRRPAREVLGLCPVVLFWPDDLQLVKAGPEARRRLLDVVASQLDGRAATDLLRYRRIVEQRNALLRSVRAGGAPRAELAGFDAALAATGARVQVTRAALVAALAPHAAATLARISGGDETLQLRYAPDGGMRSGDGVAAAEATLLAALERRRDEELARGLTLAGPHRDDVDLELGARPARTTASQGQQRSIVLAIKLAEVQHIAERTGVLPLLLLDDVLSELDPSRRRDLLDGLGEAGLQVLITTTESVVDPLPAGTRRFEVRRGSVTLAAET